MRKIISAVKRVGSRDYLLYIIVITPEDGRHERPKHVV
jgi:hypothetical protein